MRSLLWTCKSVRRLSDELARQGDKISPAKTAELLHDLGYSLQSHRKRDEGKSHPDREVRLAAIEALGEFRDPAATRALVEIVKGKG